MKWTNIMSGPTERAPLGVVVTIIPASAMPRLFLLSVLFVFTTGFGVYHTADYTIAEGYSVSFEGRGAEGTFDGLDGRIVFDTADLSGAVINVSVDAATISTGNDLKDRHARGDAWFDVENYPAIRYRATTFARTEAGFIARGELSLHGVTRAMDLPFTFERTESGGIFSGMLTVNREAFGITGPWLAFTVADEFLVKLLVPVDG